jgi:hypothetical protein
VTDKGSHPRDVALSVDCVKTWEPIDVDDHPWS